MLARGAGAIALFVSFAVPAAAEPASQSHAEAIARFQEGTALVTQRDCPGAVVKFRESLALEPGVGARLDLADCEERMGAADAAWRDFRLAEHLASERADGRAGLAHGRAAALEGRLQVVRLPHVEGLDLRVDGQTVDRELFTDGSLALSPGTHSLEAIAPGRDTVTVALSGRAGDLRVVTMAPSAAAPSSAPPPPAPVQVASSPGATQRALGLGAAGVGIVGIAVGSVAGVITLMKHHDATSACQGNYPRCSLANQEAVTSANGAAQTAGTISTVGFVLGALGLVGGAGLYLTAPSGDKSRREAWLLSPMVGAKVAGAALQGRW